MAKTRITLHITPFYSIFFILPEIMTVSAKYQYSYYVGIVNKIAAVYT